MLNIISSVTVPLGSIKKTLREPRPANYACSVTFSTTAAPRTTSETKLSESATNIDFFKIDPLKVNMSKVNNNEFPKHLHYHQNYNKQPIDKKEPPH